MTAMQHSRMAAQIVQVDLAVPLPSLAPGRRYASLCILVRFGPQPIGWVRWRAKQLGDTLSAETLAQLIADTLWREVRDVVWERKVQPLKPKKKPLISVIVCTDTTGDRCESLERQLRALAA